MSTTESPQSDFLVATASPTQAPIIVGKVIWCPYAYSKNVYYCAQQLATKTLEEFRNQGEKAMEEQRWKIELCQVEFNHLGYPSRSKHISDVSARVSVTLAGAVHSQSRKILSYAQMMELMSGFYNPSSTDVMKQMPGHISDEIKKWEHMKRLAEIRAREEYGSAPR